MTTERETSTSGLPSLAGAEWLAHPATRAVLAALRVAGYEGRVVGGSVRNALMDLPVSDLDIATPATPEAVMKACARAGLATVPTGLAHGTITVIASHTRIEVTTLRRDVATDGRHATIAYTEDWAEDAARRDFTMNALYCDAEGRLYDFVGGYPDLVARRVRFIGNADERIAEDYLRILRFFRFQATYATDAPDPAAMAACARRLPGIAQLSAERIRAELVKLLVAPGAIAALHAMEDVGLLSLLLGRSPRLDLMERLAAAEADVGDAPDAMLRLSGLAVAEPGDVARLTSRLRLSSEERKALIVIDDREVAELGTIDAHRAREIVFHRGGAVGRRLALALAAVAPDRKAEATLLRETAATWKPPVLPVSGADLIARGMQPGPEIGALLARLESWWIAQDFPPPERTLTQLEALLAARGGN
ncbi:MAG: CCA tRNA nucleotidyltransferase [Hyphomicrobiaceae bacterium]